MAFTVEDGTGVADANAYITTAYADTYHSDRGNAAWTGTSTVKEQAIVRATDYVEARWGLRFKGIKEFTDPLQPLSFPRLYIYDENGLAIEGIPTMLKRAIAEYALRALSAALLPDPDQSQGAITGTRKKVGPIETETTYATAVAPIMQAYPLADRMLQPLLALAPGHVYR